MTYETSNVNAVVLAGGINRIRLFNGDTPGYKGLLQLRGKPLMEYTLEALKKTRRVKRICIVGPVGPIRQSVSDSQAYEYAAGGETLIENIRKGLDYFSDASVVLVVPSDLPLATPETIEFFLEQCRDIDCRYKANILWSMIPQEYFTGPYAGVRKGFNRFRDISVCHGNLLLITPLVIRNPVFLSKMEQIYNARKSSIRAALAVGPLTGLAYLIGVHLLRALTISQFAAIASAAFGVGLVPISLDRPEAAVDIDEARDYDFIMEELDRREKHSIERFAS